VDAVHIEALVHQFLPEVQAVVGSVNNLLLKTDEQHLEVKYFHDIDSLLVAEKALVLLVHYMLDALLTLVKEVLVFKRRLVSEKL